MIEFSRKLLMSVVEKRRLRVMTKAEKMEILPSIRNNRASLRTSEFSGVTFDWIIS